MDFKKIFKIKNETYDILKWICLRVYPAMMTFYGALAMALKLPNTDIILTIMGAVLTFVTTCLGISCDIYKQNATKEPVQLSIDDYICKEDSKNE